MTRLFLEYRDGTVDVVALGMDSISYFYGDGIFNGDHKIDIVSAEYSSSTVGILASTEDCGGSVTKRRCARH
jgi:hypothetical protein